jgi:phage tail tape-measure protein
MKMAPFAVVAGSHVVGACGSAIRKVAFGSVAGSVAALVVPGASVPVVATVSVLASEVDGSVLTVTSEVVGTAVGDELLLSLPQAASATATMPTQRIRVVARERR